MFIYVIAQPGSSLVKIGRTANLRSRIRTLQLGCPVPLEVRGYWRVEEPVQAELALHGRFADRRQHGEWFEFGEDDAIDLVSDVLDLEAEHYAETEPRPRGVTRPQPTHRAARPGWSVHYNEAGAAQEYRREPTDDGRAIMAFGEYLEPVKVIWRDGNSKGPVPVQVPLRLPSADASD